MNKAAPKIVWTVSLAILASVLWLLEADTLQLIEAQAETLTRQKTLLKRLEDLPKREEVIKRQLADLGNDAVTQLLYEGDTNSVSSQMQRDLRQTASDAKIRLNQMRFQRTVQNDGLILPNVIQINFSSDMAGLLSFLAQLESREPILRIKKLSIRVTEASKLTRAARLSVSADVTGFSSPEGGPR